MTHLLPTFTRILARRPAPNFADGITTANLGKPDYDNAIKQYDTYIQALRDCNLELTLLPTDDRYPDGHFVEDPIVIFHDVAFMCRSGAEARQGEGESLKPHLPDLRIIEPEVNARIDGGDVLICSDRVLVGLSERTNQAGVDALCRAFQTVKPDIRVDAVPFAGVLHLKSGLTELAPNVLIHDPALTTDYSLDWATVITLPANEGYAADVMPINDTLFIAKGYPTAYQAAKDHYDKVVELDMSEFQKMDGGLTCLSLRY
jgi:dimethylargininase